MTTATGTVGDPTGARFEVAEAAEMDARADVALDPASHAYAVPQQGNGGGLIIESAENQRRPWIMDTLKASPDIFNADADADADAVRLDPLITPQS